MKREKESVICVCLPVVMGDGRVMCVYTYVHRCCEIIYTSREARGFGFGALFYRRLTKELSLY